MKPEQFSEKDYSNFNAQTGLEMVNEAHVIMMDLLQKAVVEKAHKHNAMLRSFGRRHVAKSSLVLSENERRLLTCCPYTPIPGTPLDQEFYTEYHKFLDQLIKSIVEICADASA